MSEPKQKPGQSKQDEETPPEFMAAVVKRFGPMSFDLAASSENTKAPDFYSERANAFSANWSINDGNMWLNPPYKNIAAWAATCASTQLGTGSRILMITPASVSTEWFSDFVFGKALVIAVRPRITFVGHHLPYPKDLMLSVYGEQPDFELWRWDIDKRKVLCQGMVIEYSHVESI